MANQPIALINGVNYSWLNQVINLFGVPLIGVTKIELMSEQMKENHYGYGNEAVSRGYGNKTHTGSLSVYWDEVSKIINAAPGRDILDIPPFDIPLTLSPLGASRVQPFKIVAKMAEFTKHGLSSSQGDTKIIVDLPLIVGRINW